MSEEVYRRAIQALNERDVDTVLAVTDPEIEFNSLLTLVEGEPYRGHEGVRSYLRDVTTAMRDFHVEIVELHERGDWVIAALRGSGTGVASGAGLEWESAQAAKFRDGLCVRITSHPDLESALAAAGVAS